MKTPEQITKEYLADNPPQPGKFHEFTTHSLESFAWRVQLDALGELSAPEVMARLCVLCSEVAEKKFQWTEPADCVCDGRHHKCNPNQSCGMFRFSKKVLGFVEAAVREKLCGDGLADQVRADALNFRGALERIRDYPAGSSAMADSTTAMRAIARLTLEGKKYPEDL